MIHNSGDISSYINELESYNKQVIKTHIVAGALVRGDVRNLLDKMKHYGYNIEYVENKGFLDSTFLLTGDNKSISALQKVVEGVINDR